MMIYNMMILYIHTLIYIYIHIFIICPYFFKGKMIQFRTFPGPDFGAWSRLRSCDVGGPRWRAPQRPRKGPQNMGILARVLLICMICRFFMGNYMIYDDICLTKWWVYLVYIWWYKLIIMNIWGDDQKCLVHGTKNGCRTRAREVGTSGSELGDRSLGTEMEDLSSCQWFTRRV